MKKEIKKPEHNDDFEIFVAYEKANWHKYKKMCKRFKRELKKAAKEFGPWEEGHLFEFMKIIFRAWIDYYTLGVNVMGMERKYEAEDALKDSEDPANHELDPQTKKYYEEMAQVPTRLEIAQTLLKLLEAEEDSFWKTYGKGYEDKMKAFTDYFAEYIHYMWD